MHSRGFGMACVAIGCSALSAPTAFAEDAGFYFGGWGGAGSIDLGSKAELDDTFIDEYRSDLQVVGAEMTRADQFGRVFSFMPFDIESTLDDSLDVWGVHVGYRFNRYVATEIGYVNLGEVLYRIDSNVQFFLNGGFVEEFPVEKSVHFSSAGLTAAVLGILPLGSQVELHGRAGLYFGDSRVRNRTHDIEFAENILHRRTDASATDLLAGVGATWNFNESFSVRVEYQKFFDVGDDEKTGEADVDVINLGILFR